MTNLTGNQMELMKKEGLKKVLERHLNDSNRKSDHKVIRTMLESTKETIKFYREDGNIDYTEDDVVEYLKSLKEQLEDKEQYFEHLNIEASINVNEPYDQILHDTYLELEQLRIDVDSVKELL